MHADFAPAAVASARWSRVLLTGTIATTSSLELSWAINVLKTRCGSAPIALATASPQVPDVTLAELIPVHRVGYSLLFEKF